MKEVQRLLNSVGYRPGPVDGMYGPLTRSAVQWFQIKHSLRPSGVVDAATLALLRLRAHGASPPAMPTTAPPQTAAPTAPTAPAPAPGSPAQAHKSSGDSAAPAVIAVAAAALALLLATLLLLRRRRGRREAAPAAPKPPPAPKPAQASKPTAPAPPPAPAAVGGRVLATRASERVVGYATGRHPRDLRRQAKAIEGACSERGWALTQVVRERRSANGHRPGLRFALEQLAEGAGTRLVTCRLGDVGRTQDELAGLLGWCAHSGVDLVALDVGLDTGTRHGRLVARSLVTPGKRTRIGSPLRGPAFLRRRRAKAPGVDGELASSSSP